MSEVITETQNPSHYSEGDKPEPIDVIRSIGFNLGNAYKYLDRAGKKGGANTAERDAKAAIWYMIDIMVHLLTIDDGIYKPKKKEIAAFDFDKLRAEIHNSVPEAHILNETRLILAALGIIVRRDRNSTFIGHSEAGYKDHVLSTIFVCYLAIDYAKVDLLNEKSDKLSSYYKGSKDRPISADHKVWAKIAKIFKRLDDLCDAKVQISA